MTSNLNLVLIPLMAPGHMIPMVDMAKLLSARGLTVTIVVTPLWAARFTPVITRAAASGLSVRLLPVDFPCEAAGLPPGCEMVDLMPSYDLIRNFYTAIALFQDHVEDALKSINPKPNCIICDKHIPWIAETCTKFQIPRIIFDGMSCFTQVIIDRLYVSRIYESVPPTESFQVPGLPDRIEFRKVELPGMFNPGSTDFSGFRKQIRETEKQSYGVVVNSFDDLEKGYLDEFRQLRGGKVWCIGPLSLCSNDELDRTERGNRETIYTKDCLKWLGDRDSGTVVYACLGSLSRQTVEEFIELALGLESSNHPFVLVVRGEDQSEKIEKWIVEDGFEERVKGRGFVIRGWAPQVLILSHPSVGGFLTHCGWNSTLEGISAGVPMITWPLFAEQFLNEKLVVQVLGIGVGVGSKAVVHLGEVGKREDKVGREGVRVGIERIMDKGREGCERRKRAKEMGEMAKKSMQVGGSSHVNISLLIQEIAQLSKGIIE